MDVEISTLWQYQLVASLDTSFSEQLPNERAVFHRSSGGFQPKTCGLKWRLATLDALMVLPVCEAKVATFNESYAEKRGAPW